MKALKIECPICKTKVDIDLSTITLISMDNAAEFIEQKKYRCGKCGSDCMQTMVEYKERK
jgi:hypothetical protein